MSEKLLIPLDGSQFGEASLRYAATMLKKLAPGSKVDVTLLHVITYQEHNIYIRNGLAVHKPYSKEELSEMTEKAEKYLAEASKQLDLEGVTVNIRVAAGLSEAPEIIRVEQECDIDLVIMSTHGRGGFSRFAFGSVADKVLRGGSVPVLLVRAQEK